MSFNKRYVAFLSQLEEIADGHHELTDTDVRERLHEILNYYFIWGKGSVTELPNRFAMSSSTADKRVAKAVKGFIVDALSIVEREGIDAGAPRHALIEDDTAGTSKGNIYHVFLGSSDEPLPATPPASDKKFRYEVPSKKKKCVASPLELAQLTVNVEGADITPSFDGKFNMYQYILPSGATVGVMGKTPEEVRASAKRAVEQSLKMRALLGKQ
jgi:hypothetical protein